MSAYNYQNQIFGNMYKSDPLWFCSSFSSTYKGFGKSYKRASKTIKVKNYNSGEKSKNLEVIEGRDG